MIVADASVLVALLSRGDGWEAAERLLLQSGQEIHSPHLIDAEVAHALRRLAASGRVGGAHGRRAIEALADFPIQRHPHRTLLPRAWALRHNLSVYDAFYVALAELLDAPLITRDRRLRDAPGHRARVELV